MKHHNSASEYIQDVIGTMQEINEIEPMMDELFGCWCDEVTNKCNERYQQYVDGQVEDYKLTDEDMETTLRNANTKLIGDALAELLDKGMVKMSVGKDGEVYYSTTDKGQNYNEWILSNPEM